MYDSYHRPVRFDVSSNPVRLAIIAPIGGVVVFAMDGFFGIGRLGRFSLEETAIAAIFGLLAGTGSIVYVVPLLTWTNIRRSVPLVYGGSLAAAVATGLLNVGTSGLFIVIGLHVALCVVSAFVFRKTERRAMECPQCRYLLRGVRDPRCPECGIDLEKWRRKVT